VNEDLKDRLSRYLDALESGVTKAGEFVGGEIGETVREFIVWRITESFVSAGVLVVAAVVAAFLIRRARDYALRMAGDEANKLTREDWLTGSRVLSVFMYLAPILLSFFVVQSVHRGVKAVVAPRVVLLEEVATVVKTYGGQK